MQVMQLSSVRNLSRAISNRFMILLNRWKDCRPLVVLMMTASALALAPQILRYANTHGKDKVTIPPRIDGASDERKKKRLEWRQHRKQRRTPLKEAQLLASPTDNTRMTKFDLDTHFEEHLPRGSAGNSDGRVGAKTAALTAVERRVQCGDAVEFLRASQAPLPGHVVTSLPDISEVGMTLEAYTAFFCECVERIVQRLPLRGVAIFYQSDARCEGQYLDKSVLVQLAAQKCGAHTLWHKIALYNENASQKSHGRPPYSHMVAVSRGVRANEAWVEAAATPDVLQRGSMAWARAMGGSACAVACSFVRAAVEAEKDALAKEAAAVEAAAVVGSNDGLGSEEGEKGRSKGSAGGGGDGTLPAPPIPACVIDPFAGHGTVLAVANEMGMHSFGIELSRKRCRTASTIRVLNSDDGPSSYGREDSRSSKPTPNPGP